MLRPSDLTEMPKGYKTYVTNAGIKDTTLDLGIVVSDIEANAAAVFTKNKIKGNPVLVGQKHIKKGKTRAVIVNSKNSNVATGKAGFENTLKVCKQLASQLNCKSELIFPSSTGVIGRPLPVDKILSAIEDLPQKLANNCDFVEFAHSIMTTDTFPKFGYRKIGDVTLVGVAKGSGMLEPNMATMLSYFFTDAKISSGKLKKMLNDVIAPTFNSLSVDSDTSTSDTVHIMANGIAGKPDLIKFKQEFLSLATELTEYLARDGEGATKLFRVHVTGAKSAKEAKKIGKSIINSPLVKTAIYKGDPNWGRIFMAIGKTPGVKIKPNKIKLFWGNPGKEYNNNELNLLSQYMNENEVLDLRIDLNCGNKNWTVFGCDYTEEYVKINAYYTT